MTETWIDVGKALPWLEVRPPFFVRRDDEEKLGRDLTAAGFDVRAVEGAKLRDEASLLTALGVALGFPSYYGRNWDAYIDCVGDLAEAAEKPVAIVWSGSETLLSTNPHGFVRAVHILLDNASDLARSDARFQLELFFTGAGPGYDV